MCKWKFGKLNCFYNCLMLLNWNWTSPRKQFGRKANHICFLVFYILRLSRKWAAGCGIWTREGNWVECGRKRLKTGHCIPHPSRWPWPQVPHFPNDNVPLRRVPHQGWLMETTWKLKSSVPKSDPSSATNRVIVGKIHCNSGFPLGNEGIAFPLLFIIMQGRARSPYFSSFPLACISIITL